MPPDSSTEAKAIAVVIEVDLEYLPAAAPGQEAAIAIGSLADSFDQFAGTTANLSIAAAIVAAAIAIMGAGPVHYSSFQTPVAEGDERVSRDGNLLKNCDDFCPIR